MKTPTPKPLTTPDPTAVALVETLEQRELGSDIAAAARAAVEAIATQRAEAIARLYPVATSTEASDWHAIEFHTGHAPIGAGFGPAMAEVHRAALGAHPGLGALIRSQQIRNACARAVAPAERAAAQAAFDVMVARALIEAGHDLAEHARALLEADTLTERVAAVRERHVEHQAELERERVAAELEAKQAAVRALEVAVKKIEAEPFTVETAASREYRLMNAGGALLAARIGAAGIETLRIGRAPYDARSIASLAAAGQLGLSQLDLYSNALAETGA